MKMKTRSSVNRVNAARVESIKSSIKSNIPNQRLAKVRLSNQISSNF